MADYNWTLVIFQNNPSMVFLENKFGASNTKSSSGLKQNEQIH